MTYKEAYQIQHKELNSCNKKISRLENQISRLEAQVDRYQRGIAAEEVFKQQLSRIRGLKNKVSQFQNIAGRYESMYEQKKRELAVLISKYRDLECLCQKLQWQIDEFTGRHSFEGITAAQQADARIRELEDEVARLNALLNKDGMNTGIPTSKTAIDKKKVIPNSREKTDRHIGAQPGHEKHFMPAFPDDEITESVSHTLEHCPDCGGELIELAETNRDELDYEIRIVKKRHFIKEYLCSKCGKRFRTGSPSLKAENQYGSMIQALALAFMNFGFISINRTKTLLSGLTSDILGISEGYLCKLQKRFSGKLLEFREAVRTACIASGFLYWDDTVVFVNTSRACFRFYGNESLALYCAHMKKDLDGIFEDNLLPCLPESVTVMHDHNSINYHEGFSFSNVECLQHLERDLQKVTDQSYHSWSGEMKELFRSMMHKRKVLISQGIDHFDEKDISRFLCQYDGLLKTGYKEYFKDNRRYFAQTENALLLRLEKYRQNYTAWIYDFSIPTTNNLSERSLRFIKCKDKISGQFQNIEHAQYFANIRTYIETCARNGINEFQALLRLTQDRPFTLQELLSTSGAL